MGIAADIAIIVVAGLVGDDRPETAPAADSGLYSGRGGRRAVYGITVSNVDDIELLA